MVTDLLDFWFDKNNEHIWFEATNIEDNYINLKYSFLLKNDDFNNSNLSNRDYLKYILLYDQVTRHIDRVNDTEIRYKFKDKALEYSRYLIESGKYLNFKPEEICFILMPLRHTFDLHNLFKVKNLVIELLESNPDNSYFRRFYRATITSIANIKKPKLYSKIKEFNKDLLCTSCLFNESNINQEFDNTKNNIPKYFTNYFKQCIQNKKITISLSGGSDSMVCLYICVCLGFEVTALMINYCNRDCSNEEVDNVAVFCKYLNVPFYVRTIDEIQRTNDYNRDFYESITKKIRFDSYKFLGNPVILGHNWNDCVENIITNINKSRSFDNLLGMNYNSIQSDITLIRPMLNIKKHDINEFANIKNIPYFKDSTPKWSDRGKIRDKLIPALEDFNSNLVSNLVEMSNRYKEIYSLFNELIMEKTKIIKKEDNIYHIIFVKCYSFDYWKNIFSLLNTTYGLDFPKKKSIDNFINNLRIQIIDKNFVLTKKMSANLKESYLEINYKF